MAKHMPPSVDLPTVPLIPPAATQRSLLLNETAQVAASHFFWFIDAENA